MTLFRLMLPPSSNDLVRPIFLGYVNGKASVRLVATGAAKKFRRHAHSCLPVAPIDGAVELFATFYVPSISSDCNNRLKALEDACNGRLFYDDSQIAEAHTRKVPTSDPEQVGVVFEVRPAIPGEHPELAARLAKSTIQERANAARQPELDLVLEPEDDETPASSLPEGIRDRLKKLAKPASYPAKVDDDELPPWGGAA